MVTVNLLLVLLSLMTLYNLQKRGQALGDHYSDIKEALDDIRDYQTI
jgi:hypothetical protein